MKERFWMLLSGTLTPIIKFEDRFLNFLRRIDYACYERAEWAWRDAQDRNVPF